jgi:hypothetical protein
MKAWIKKAFIRANYSIKKAIERDRNGIAALGEACAGSNQCENMDVTTCYFCTDKAPDQGQLDERDCLESNNSCCGYGCQFSRDYPDGPHWPSYGAILYGKRFLPYYDPARFIRNDGSTTFYQRRNANGYLADLLTNVPQLVPPDIRYMIFPVFRNETGEECPIADACRYSDRNWPSSHTPPCDGGERFGESMKAWYSDCMFHSGSNVPPEDGSHCRTINDRTTIKVVGVPREPLNNTIFLRTGFNAPPHFITNMLIPIISKVVVDNNSCQSSYGNDQPRIDAGIEYYLDAINGGLGIRRRFDHMQILLPTTVNYPQFKDTTLPINKLRNAVLKHVTTTALPRDNNNTQDLFQVDLAGFNPRLYFRDYNHGGGNIPLLPAASLAKVQGIDLRGRLKYKRTPVNVELVIKRAKLDISIIAHRVQRTIVNDSNDPLCYPHCKAKYFITLGVRASMNPINVTYPWIPDIPDASNPEQQDTLTLPAYDIYNSLPKISPAKDYIEYYIVENGVEHIVDIPEAVEWHGALNSFSNPVVPRIQFDHSFSLKGMATTLANKVALSGTGAVAVRIQGLPTSIDSVPDDRNTIYKGSIRIGFMPA